MLTEVIAHGIAKSAGGWAAKIALNWLYDQTRESDLEKLWHKAAQGWVRGLPPNLELHIAALFIPFGTGTGTAQQALANCLQKGQIPDQIVWETALLERFDEVTANSNLNELSSFFQLPRDQDDLHLSGLAAALRDATRLHEQSALATVFGMVEEIREVLRRSQSPRLILQQLVIYLNNKRILYVPIN